MVEPPTPSEGGDAHDLVVLAVERLQLLLGALVVRRRPAAMLRKREAAPGEAGERGPRPRPALSAMRAARSTAWRRSSGGAKWFGDGPQQEEVDQDLLGAWSPSGGGLRPSLVDDLLDVEHAVLRSARSRAAPARSRRGRFGCTQHADLEAVVGARSGAGCPGTARCASSPRRRKAPSVWPSSRSTGVRRLNLISLSLKYVWRIASPGVNVTSSACGKRGRAPPAVAAEDRRRVDARERHAQALDRLDPGPQDLGVGDRGVEHAVVAPALGLASLQDRRGGRACCGRSARACAR